MAVELEGLETSNNPNASEAVSYDNAAKAVNSLYSQMLGYEPLVNTDYLKVAISNTADMLSDAKASKNLTFSLLMTSKGEAAKYFLKSFKEKADYVTKLESGMGKLINKLYEASVANGDISEYNTYMDKLREQGQLALEVTTMVATFIPSGGTSTAVVGASERILFMGAEGTTSLGADAATIFNAKMSTQFAKKG